jgi:LPXTG-motif cell wall-anchored protein
VVEVNPTATGTVSYPTATPACAADPPPSSSGGSLPATGTNAAPWIQLALALVVAGALALLVRRRLART